MKHVRPEIFLFAAFFATIPIYSPNLVMFRDNLDAAEATMPFFVDTLLIATTVCGLIFALISGRTEARRFYRPGFVIVAALCDIVGYGLYIGGLTVSSAEGIGLAIAAGIILGFAVVELSICWGAFMSRYGLREALFWMAVSVGIGSLIEMLYTAVPFAFAVVLFYALLIASVLVPCVKSAKGNLVCEVESDGADAETSGDLDEASLFGSLSTNVHSLGRLLVVPFTGLMVFAFVMAVRKMVFYDIFYADVLGGFLGALVVLPTAFLRKVNPLMPLVHQVLLPAFALLLIILNSFPAGTPVMIIASGLSYVFFDAVGILALASLCALAHGRELSPPLIYSITCGSFALVSLLGVICGSLPLFEIQDGGPALLVISTCFFAFLLAFPLASSWFHEQELPRLQEAAKDEGESPVVDVATRCDDLARSSGLSPRETEILGYLGRGHGVAFIAKTLVISESTVRTHVKNIYRKLGVSSRDELIQLVEGDAPQAER